MISQLSPPTNMNSSSSLEAHPVLYPLSFHLNVLEAAWECCWWRADQVNPWIIWSCPLGKRWFALSFSQNMYHHFITPFSDNLFYNTLCVTVAKKMLVNWHLRFQKLFFRGSICLFCECEWYREYNDLISSKWERMRERERGEREGERQRQKKWHSLEELEVVSYLFLALEDFNMTLVENKILSRLFSSGLARINHL